MFDRRCTSSKRNHSDCSLMQAASSELPVVCTAHYPDMNYMGDLDVLQRVLPYLESGVVHILSGFWSSAYIMTQGEHPQ